MRFVEDYLKVKPTSLKPMPGRILIAVPFFDDAFFHRTVVLLTDYEEESTAGLVLNKESDVSVQKIVNDIKVDDPLYIGGPMMTSAVFGIHNHENTKKSAQLIPGVYVGYDDTFLALIEHKAIESIRYRFFLGYAGWSPGQLEKELKNSMWVVSNANPDLIFNTPTEEIWKNAVSQLGENYQHWLSIPENFDDN